MSEISPDYARRLTVKVRETYEAAEDYVLQQLVKRLTTNLDEDNWRDLKQRELQRVIQSLSGRLDGLDKAAQAEIWDVTSKAYTDGTLEATSEAAQYGLETSAASAAAMVDEDGVNPAVRALAKESIDALDGVPNQILRAAADAYQRVTSESSLLVLTGSATRREASRQLLRSVLLDGIRPLRDVSGRVWEAGSYAEMAVRTTTGKAAIQGHTDQLQQLGQDLVIVSASPESCDLCGPWEGEILSISGRDPTGRAKGSIADARADGLQHPNCTHTVDIYLHGITRKPEITRTDAGYKTRQRQRAFERSIRRHKRSVLIDEETMGEDSAEAKLARRKLRARQAEFKTWRDENDRKNLSYRTNTRSR